MADAVAAPSSNGTHGEIRPGVEAVVKPENGDIVDGEEDEDEGEDEEGDAAGVGAAKKKKKKKPKKKKKGGAGSGGAGAAGQTEPPTVPLSKLFPNGQYPEGEIQEYKDDNAFRTTSEEKRHLERLRLAEEPDSPYNYNAIRKGAEVHRQVRQYAQKNIKPGMKMIDIADMIENGTRSLVEANGLKAGIGFPTGLSRNHCAAHYTPTPGDDIVLGGQDVLKVDIGVQVNGRILDSAFTLTFEPTWNRLLDSVKDATNSAIREAGIDARLSELGGIIQEVMESYEVEVQGKTYPVKSIKNLSGHSIEPYQIHGKKSVPLLRDHTKGKMEEGEYYAIETFGSTGHGEVVDDRSFPVSHFAKRVDASFAPLRLQSAKELLAKINKYFGTIPFCQRYLEFEDGGQAHNAYALRTLQSSGIVQGYPALSDVKGSMTAQFEHTILLRPTCKEVVSRGDDY